MHLEELVIRRNAARREAHALLEAHEAAESRVVILNESFNKLTGLPVDVAKFYREALKSLGVGCYRAAVVMAWAGFFHLLAENMVVHHQPALISEYPKWDTGTTTDLTESAPEYQILEAGKKVGLYNNQKLSIYKGWLSQRHQSAHPTLHEPTRNVALGYVDGILSEVSLYL